ncbi:MAG TPA: flagellar hook-length control protein FliK, partial [Gammaproteobacteria bacterium]|nr:flagellar hook-length control protein FliK [Gammaproteobacteria bacterium]
MADQPLPSVQTTAPASAASAGPRPTAPGSAADKSQPDKAGQTDTQGGTAFAQLLNGRLSKASPQAIEHLVNELKAKLEGAHGRSSGSEQDGKKLPPDQLLAALLASLVGTQASGQSPGLHGQDPAAQDTTQSEGGGAKAAGGATAAARELALLARQLGLTESGNTGDKASGTAGDGKAGAQQLPAALVKLLQSGDGGGGSSQNPVAQAVHDALTGAAGGGGGSNGATKPPVLPSQLTAALQQAIARGVDHGKEAAKLVHTLDATAAAAHGGNPTATAPVPSTASPAQGHPALPTANIQTPMHQAGWDQALGERVKWMVGQNLQGAQLRVTPAHLGPIDVHISIHNDQASVAFSAQHAMTREHLEAAIPRLREMLGGS